MAESITATKQVAILGGGPSGLFLYKKFIESNYSGLEISIFERQNQLGLGMPYGYEGANDEHIANVSDNEIPELVISIAEWVKIAPKAILDRFNITVENFNSYKVLPRLFLGAYLSAQFELLLQIGRKAGITTNLFLSSTITNIVDEPHDQKVVVHVAKMGALKFDTVAVCTGHYWRKKYEGKIPGYFDSPYPPRKLKLKLNHPVALKGSSLTAVDAIRTLARYNGEYYKDSKGNLAYRLANGNENFKLVMHSRSGLLPAVRFHLEDSQLNNDSLLTHEELDQHKKANHGFISLDYIFEKDFKEMFRSKRPAFYEQIKNLDLENFVALMMDYRETLDPFELLKLEYEEAEKSIEKRKSIYWKEMLAVLSFAMNYPAKYLSAEDMLRLKENLMPLIGIVIAFVPQSSCEELLALHNAHILEIVAVGEDRNIVPELEGGVTYTYSEGNKEEQSTYYKTFIDCVGQPHLSFEQFPFIGLLDQKVISPARLKFSDPKNAKAAIANGQTDIEKLEDDNYYLRVPGIAINDNFQVVDNEGFENERIYMMAVPYIGGFNPDYSGLDFCAAASDKIAKSILS